MINISLLPSIIGNLEKLVYKGSFLTLWLVFIIYWICNPNLGQTTFWLVGSANYIWPLMWASSYFLYLLHLLTNKERLNFKKSILLSFFGIFAGLSNEATGISTKELFFS